jgi:hypothetical protein
MSAADVVITVIVVLFLAGVLVGIAVVYAFSARQADRVRRGRSAEARDASRGKSDLPV